MESFCTAFSGLIRWMPSPSTSPVTLPNSVRIPTLPVGIEVVLENSRITSSTIAKIFSNRLRKTEKPPPKSPKSRVRPVFVISVSARNGLLTGPLLLHLAPHFRPRGSLHFRMDQSITGGSRAGKRWRKSTGAATGPQHLVWFLLDTIARSRNNPPHLAASGRHAQRKNGPWGKHNAISAWLDRS